MKKLIFLIFLHFFTCCSVEKKTNQETKQTYKKAGVGIVAFHPEYKNSENPSFELYEDRDLKKNKSSFSPKKDNSFNIDFYDAETNVYQMICLGWAPGYYKVNTRKGENSATYLPEDKKKYIHLSWKVYLPKVKKVWRIDPASNPVLSRPKFMKGKVDWDTTTKTRDEFIPLETKAQWLKIKTRKTNQEGWIRWAKNSQLLIDLEPIAISEIYEDIKNIQSDGRLPEEKENKKDSTDKQK